MRHYGLVSREAARLLNDLREREKAAAKVIPLFVDNRARQMQSINRFMEEIFTMAAKAKKAVTNGSSGKVEFAWKGFIDVKLSDQDKANYAAWDVMDGDVWDGMATYCEAGIKIALSFNQQNASYNCAGTGQGASGANNGYCVVAHAKTPYEAARVWLYKVAVMLPAVWNEYDAGDDDGIG